MEKLSSTWRATTSCRASSTCTPTSSPPTAAPPCRSTLTSTPSLQGSRPSSTPALPVGAISPTSEPRSSIAPGAGGGDGGGASRRRGRDQDRALLGEAALRCRAPTVGGGRRRDRGGRA